MGLNLTLAFVEIASSGRLFAAVRLVWVIEEGSVDLAKEAAKLWELDAHIEVGVHKAGVEVYCTLIVFVRGRVAHLWVGATEVSAEGAIDAELGGDLASVVVVDVAKTEEVGALEGVGGQGVLVLANGDDVRGRAVNAEVCVFETEVVGSPWEVHDLNGAINVSESDGPFLSAIGSLANHGGPFHVLSDAIFICCEKVDSHEPTV